MKTVNVIVERYPETNGLTMKGLREDAGLTLEDLAAALHMEVDWVKAVEDGDDYIDDDGIEYIGMMIGPLGRMKKYMRGLN